MNFLDLLDTFHFIRPWWLLALLGIPFVLFWVIRRRATALAWAEVCDPHLLPHLLDGGDQRDGTWPRWVVGLAAALAILALAGPSWEQRPQPLYRGGDAQVIVLDLSRSMNAADVKPSRLERARYKIADLLNDTDEGQVALVVFAGDAFVVSPLTDDANTVLAMLGALTPDIMPSQGGRASRGLELAGELLSQAGIASGRVLLVADAVDPEANQVAAELGAAGHRVSVLAVGTPAGAPIPVDGGGFLKSSAGDIVVPRLNVVALRAVAAEGNGRMERLRPDNLDLESLTAVDDWTYGPEGRETDVRGDAWREEGPWLVLLLLPLSALAFRRGWLACFALLFWLPGDPALAAWEDLWQRPDQRAQQALDRSAPAEAAALAESPWLRGTAEYQAGDFSAAERSFSELDTADGHYNRGNALARMGRFEEAIAAYDAALEREPDMEDALHNKGLLEQQQQQQQNQQDQGEQQDQPDGSQGESSEQGEPGEEGDQQEQQSGDSDSSEGEEQEQAPAEQSGEESGEQQGEQRVADSADPLSEEERQAVEQWLRRIPDDPGGLLRRKFLLQYRQRGGGDDRGDAW